MEGKERTELSGTGEMNRVDGKERMAVSRMRVKNGTDWKGRKEQN